MDTMELISIIDLRVYRLAQRMRKMESTINKLQHEIEELKEIKKDLTKSEDKKSV